MTIAKGKANPAIRYLIAKLPNVPQTSTLISTARSGTFGSFRDFGQVGSRKNCRRAPAEEKGEDAEGRKGPEECV